MFINEVSRKAETMIPIFPLAEAKTEPGSKPHTHLMVCIYYSKPYKSFILSINPCHEDRDGCVSVMMDPSPGYSFFGIAKEAKRYNANDLTQLALTFQENFKTCPMVINLLKYHHYSLTPAKETAVNTVTTVIEVTDTTTEPDTSEPNIIPFPNPITTLLTTPTVTRFLANS